MFFLRRPTEAQIRDYLARQTDQPFSYSPVGGTRHVAPLQYGWDTDRHRVLLGHGEGTFMRAKEAINDWAMFPSEMVRMYAIAPPHEAQTVAGVYRAAPIGMWLLFAARVIYVFNESFERAGQEVHRFGFAYGTLPDHPECGEERFMVEWDRSDDRVEYDLLAISQPRHWLARLGYPYARYEQARFRRLSGAAMQRAVISRP